MLEKGILCKRFRLCIIGGLHVTSSVIWKKEQVYFEGSRRLYVFYVMVAEGMVPTIRNQIALIPLVGVNRISSINTLSTRCMHNQSRKQSHPKKTARFYMELPTSMEDELSSHFSLLVT